MSEDVFRWVIAVCAGLACIAFLLQAGLAIIVYRVARGVQEKITVLNQKMEPIFDTARRILDENRPRIAAISTDVASASADIVQVTKALRVQTERVSELVHDASTRAQLRISQLDEKVDETVAHVEQAGEAVKSAVMKPLVEANAVMAGIRAALLTLAQGRRHSVDHATQDEEMFI